MAESDQSRFWLEDGDVIFSNVVKLNPPKRSNKIDLIKTVIEKLTYAQKDSDGKVKQQLYWDKKLPGFGLLVGLASKTFIYQRDVDGKSRRTTIGRFGELTAQQARSEAEKLKTYMKDGVDPRDAERKKAADRKKQAVTLREALETYKAKTGAGALSEKTKLEVTRLFEQRLGDWMGEPLTSITPEAVLERHKKIAADVKANPRYKNAPTYSGSIAKGENTANRAMRTLRTVYTYYSALNDVARNPPLPANPVIGLSTLNEWFKEDPRTNTIKPAQLKIWLAAVGRLANDVQRDYLLLLLFTGLRRNEAAAIKWEDVDFEEASLRIPITKNKKPLDLPLSTYLIALLTARKARYGDKGWVFPAKSTSGHIEEPRAALDRVAAECGVAVSVHDLRRSFISLAESCDVPAYVFKALVNHSTGGDVTGDHYIQMSIDRMRPWMQRITDEILRLGTGEIVEVQT